MDILTTNVELLTVNGTTSMEGAVRYDIPQTLSEEQKIQAQDNIGANGKYGTLTQINVLNSAMYDINMRHNQLAAAEQIDAANIETNTKDIEDLKNAAKNYGTRVYNTGRGGYNAFERMTLTDQYDNLGNGKHISITRESEWGTSTVECGYTVSEDGRYKAETSADTVISGVGSYTSSTNYSKLWFMPIDNASDKGFIDGSIMFTIDTPSSSVSFMPILNDGDKETNNWSANSQYVYSINNYVAGHPITLPFSWKNLKIYGIGIKGSSSSVSVTINHWYAKYRATNG